MLLAALAHGVALEQLADLVEDDNGTALHIIAQRKRAHGGNGHQEALVKGLAVLDAQQCLAEHIPADHQIGDAVEQQLHRRRELGSNSRMSTSTRAAMIRYRFFFCFLFILYSPFFWVLGRNAPRRAGWIQQVFPTG